jgi:hypothetical protein
MGMNIRMASKNITAIFAHRFNSQGYRIGRSAMSSGILCYVHTRKLTQKLDLLRKPQGTSVFLVARRKS